MVDFADYRDLGPGLYDLNNCAILARYFGNEEWFDFGDCDSARIEISTTKLPRKAKNKRVRNTAIEIVTDVSASLAIRAMQYSDDLRSIALLGTAVPHTQAIVAAGVFNIKNAKIDGIYFVGSLDIAAVTAKEAVYDEEDETFTAGDALVAGSFEVVDAAAGAIQLLGGFADGDSIQLGFTAPAIAAADKRTRIDFGTVTSKQLEVKIRGLGENGTPYEFHLNRWLATPSGIDLIGGDDFSGQDLSGTLAAVGGKLGVWQRLSV